MTLAEGHSRQILAVASTPFTTGIWTSTRMMSGRCCSASLTACSPLTASPITFKPGSSSSSVFNPWRIRVWSSANKMRMGEILFTFQVFFSRICTTHRVSRWVPSREQRQACFEHCSLGFAVGRIEDAAKSFHPLAKSAQAVVTGLVFRERRQTHSIVGDAQPHLPLSTHGNDVVPGVVWLDFEADVGGASPRMFFGVGKALLGDPPKHFGDSGRKPIRSRPQIAFDFQACTAGGLGAECRKDLTQRALAQAGGAKTGERPAQLLHARPSQRLHLVHECGSPARIHRIEPLSGFELHCKCDQSMSEAVVQFAGQALALTQSG